MKLRLFFVSLAVVLAVAIVGAALSPSELQAQAPKKITIGLSLDTLKEERWQRDRDNFVARAKELGASVLVQSANSDDTAQIRDIQALINRKVDVIVIVPHNGEAVAKGVDLAKQAGIPVIAYDRLISNSDVDLYLSFDNVKVGELQAKYLIDHLPTPGHGSIIRIYGAKTDHNALLFKQGQDNILKPYIDNGSIKVLFEDWAEDWKPENAKKITNAAITQNGKNFDAVLAANDGTAGGAIQALLEEGLAGKVIVIGQDAELAACQRIIRGTQTMTIYKPIKKLALTAAELAVKMGSHQPIAAKDELNNGKINVPSVFLDVFAIDKNNMDVVINDGFHTKDQIYAK